ncbi:MAG: polymer-forming cytoskeletal protein [Pseudomonadota bacterium]
MTTFRAHRGATEGQGADGGFSQKPAGAIGGSGVSVIGSELVIVGDVQSSGEIKVDGTIRGDVACSKVTVSENGEIQGGISAELVVIHGKASGSIKGRSVMLHATARVEADIKHQGIGIEMGTRYDGTLQWVDDSELQPAQVTNIRPATPAS